MSLQVAHAAQKETAITPDLDVSELTLPKGLSHWRVIRSGQGHTEQFYLKDHIPAPFPEGSRPDLADISEYNYRDSQPSQGVTRPTVRVGVSINLVSHESDPQNENLRLDITARIRQVGLVETRCHDVRKSVEFQKPRAGWLGPWSTAREADIGTILDPGESADFRTATLFQAALKKAAEAAGLSVASAEKLREKS